MCGGEGGGVSELSLERIEPHTWLLCADMILGVAVIPGARLGRDSSILHFQ